MIFSCCKQLCAKKYGTLMYTKCSTGLANSASVFAGLYVGAYCWVRVCVCLFVCVRVWGELYMTSSIVVVVAAVVVL